MKAFSFLVLSFFISFESAWAACESDLIDFLSDVQASCLAASSCPGGSIRSFEITTNQGGPIWYCWYRSCSSGQIIGNDGWNFQYCSSNTMEKIRNNFPKQSNMCGSIINVENQQLGESIPISGTGMTLNHFSQWTTGYRPNYEYTTKIFDASPDAVYDKIEVTVTSTDGQYDFQTFYPSTSLQNYTFTWNGYDLSSNLIDGPRDFEIAIKTYYVGKTFTIPQKVTTTLGRFNPMKIGLGGWVPDLYAYYVGGRLYKGDGTSQIRQATALSGGQQLVTDESSGLAYVFNSSGKLLETKSALLGTVINTFSYDLSGNLSSITDAFSKTIQFNRSSSVLSSIVAPYGQTSTISINSAGFISSITNPQSEVYSLTYYSSGLLSTFEKPEGQTSTFTYDSKGYLSQDGHSGGYFVDFVNSLTSPTALSAVSRMARETTYSWDYSVSPYGTNYTSTRTPPGRAAETSGYYTYGAGSMTTSQYHDGVSETLSYSTDTRLTADSSFLSDITIAYSPVNYSIHRTQSVSLSNPSDPFSITGITTTASKGALVVVTNYDPSTKTSSSATSIGRTTETVVDSYERVVSEQVGNLHPIELTYTGEKVTKIAQDTRETNLTYNSTTGFLSSISNPLSQSTAFAYDSVGRVISKIYPDLRTVSFSYDGNGNLTGITPPGRTIHSFGFNSSELPSTYEPPTLSGVTTVNTTYTYNNDKQLTQIDKPNGDSIQYSYNSTTGLLESITTPTETYAVAINGQNGKISTITPTVGAAVYLGYAGPIPTEYNTYDSSSNYIGTFINFLASNGTISTSRVTNSTGTSDISYTYDDDELLTGAGDLTLTNDTPNGMLTATSIGTSPNIVTDAYTYNSFGEVTGYQAKYGTTVIYDLALGRDGMGRINSKTQIMNSTTDAYAYTFDTTGRLTQVNKNSSTVATYGYDDNSNRNSGTIGAQTTTATYDAQDRMTAYNLLTFTYNANGDLTSKTNTLTSTTTSYVYDVFGNLTSVTLPSSDVITYEIDGLNRRIGKSINGTLQARWVYMDQTRIAAELDGSGNITKRFVYASKGNIPDYMIMGGDNYRIISDHLGSPRLVVKVSDGSITGRMDHDEYGRVTANTNPGLVPFGFAGGLYDTDTGLVRFGARDYDSETGRWTSKDPILFGGGDTNLFGYTFQDPVNWIDPSGLKITDQTGGKIPAEVIGSRLYRDLDRSTSVAITIGLNSALPAEGFTKPGSGGRQIVEVNPGIHKSYADLIDTYIHELNHASLNIAYKNKTTEFFDTKVILPTVINNNFGSGGISNGQCR